MVTVYTTQTCSYCLMVKKYLEMKGVEFNAVDITDDIDIRQKLLEKTGMMTVPITTDGKSYVVGWNIPGLMGLINNG